jgi:hypothetical protein
VPDRSVLLLAFDASVIEGLEALGRHECLERVGQPHPVAGALLVCIGLQGVGFVPAEHTGNSKHKYTNRVSGCKWRWPIAERCHGVSESGGCSAIARLDSRTAHSGRHEISLQQRNAERVSTNQVVTFVILL